MKTLSLQEMEIVDAGGDWITGACGAFAVGVGTYAIGVAANWWNPVGWLGTAAIGTVGIACGSYAIYRALTY